MQASPAGAPARCPAWCGRREPHDVHIANIGEADGAACRSPRPARPRLQSRGRCRGSSSARLGGQDTAGVAVPPGEPLQLAVIPGRLAMVACPAWSPRPRRWRSDRRRGAAARARSWIAGMPPGPGVAAAQLAKEDTADADR